MKRQKSVQNTPSTIQADQSVQPDSGPEQQFSYGLEYALDEMTETQQENGKTGPQIDWFGLSDLTPD